MDHEYGILIKVIDSCVAGFPQVKGLDCPSVITSYRKATFLQMIPYDL